MPGKPGRLTQCLYGLVPIAVAACMVVAVVVLGGKAAQGYELRQEARAAEQRIDQLKRENRRLTQQLDSYQSDAYAEKEAREELGLVKPGEVAVVLLPAGGYSPPPLAAPHFAPTSVPLRPDQTTWQRWLAIFAGQD